MVKMNGSAESDANTHKHGEEKFAFFYLPRWLLYEPEYNQNWTGVVHSFSAALAIVYVIIFSTAAIFSTCVPSPMERLKEKISSKM